MRLTNSLTGCVDSGLVIAADNITLNLNGKSITGNGIDNLGVDAGIDNSAGHTGVTIRGLRDKPWRIRGFEQGVLVQGAGVTGNAIRRFIVTNNRIGIQFDSDGNSVNGVRAIGNAENGIAVFGGDDNVMQGNRVSGNGDIGMLLTPLGTSADSNELLNNTVTRNADEGIHLDNAHSNLVRGNNASANGRPNDEDGIDLDDSTQNTIEFNTTNANGEDGLDLNNSDNNTFRSNIANNNPEDGLDIASGNDNTFEANRFLGNDNDGVEQDPGDRNTYERNIANDNADNGFNIDGNDNVLNENVAKRNGHKVEDDQGLGIDATDDPTVTGGANIAVRNDDPTQCDPFVPLCG